MIAFILASSTWLTGQFFNPPARWNLSHRIHVSIEHISIPERSDTGEATQILVELEMRNSCDELAQLQVFAHEDYPRVLQVYAEAFRKEGDCLPTTQNLTRTVDLGVLSAGTYEIRDFINLQKLLGTLKVDASDQKLNQQAAQAPLERLMVSANDTALSKLQQSQ
jgi:hypothetical protein